MIMYINKRQAKTQIINKKIAFKHDHFTHIYNIKLVSSSE